MEGKTIDKEHLYRYCEEDINTRIKRIEGLMKDAQKAANEETKSTAGDKHDTSRAMMHNEKDKLAGQLNDVLLQKAALAKISTKPTLDKVMPGSLIVTNQGTFYISISVGKINYQDTLIFAISSASPIGKLMLGKTTGEEFSFNNKVYTIQNLV